MRPSTAAVPLLLLAVALAWCGGLDHPAPTAGLLALALVAVAVLRGPWWLQLLTIGAATHLAVRAVRIGDDPADVLPALLPSAWPLLAVLATALAALVRLDTVRPGRELPLVGHVVVGAALLGVAASGPVGWFFATLTFLGAVPEPADYRHAVGFALGSAALLVVAVPLLRLRWRSWSPVAPAALGLLVQAGVVAACLPRAGGWPSLDPAYVEWAALVPTSWPLGVLLLVAAVTGVPGAAPWQGGAVEHRRGAPAVLGLTVAVVACWLNGLLVRTVRVDLQLFGESADRSDYRVAAGAGLMTALLLLLGLLAVVSLRAPAWLAYVAGAGLATQLALGLTAWWSSRGVEDTVVLPRSAWDGVRAAVVLPGSWPLLAVLVVAVVVRARSSRAPR